MKFLITIFLVFILFVFLFGFSILRFLFGGLFGTVQNQRKANRQSQNKKQTQQKSKSNTKKIFNPNEGEYIDYEEIKE
jgi:Sec-independent protein translocase protein TatA